MGSLTNYLENELLDHVFGCGTTNYSAPGSVYLALFTSDPGETGSVAGEVGASKNYSRATITFNAATGRSIVQAASVQFGTASSQWGTVGYWGICESKTRASADVMAYGSFSPAKVVNITNTPTVSIADPITITFTTSATSGFTSWLTAQLLNHSFRNTTWGPKSTYYIGLATAAIATDDDTVGEITEVSGGSYARSSLSTWETANSGSVTNSQTVQFIVPTASWATVESVFLATSVSGSTIIAFDNSVMDNPDQGDDVSIPVNQLKITLD